MEAAAVVQEESEKNENLAVLDDFRGDSFVVLSFSEACWIITQNLEKSRW